MARHFGSETMSKTEQEVHSKDRIEIRADCRVRLRIRKQMKRLAMSLSAYVRQAIIERLERDEKSEQS
jgi:hypothetical protein